VYRYIEMDNADPNVIVWRLEYAGSSSDAVGGLHGPALFFQFKLLLSSDYKVSQGKRVFNQQEPYSSAIPTVLFSGRKFLCNVL
jgi:hypothetical protein